MPSRAVVPHQQRRGAWGGVAAGLAYVWQLAQDGALTYERAEKIATRIRRGGAAAQNAWNGLVSRFGRKNKLAQYDINNGVPRGEPVKKKQKVDRSEPIDQMGGPGYSGNIRRTKKTYGAKKKHTLEKVYKRVMANDGFVIGRWQSLLGSGNFAAGVPAHYLANVITGASPNFVVNFPMYAFNLSTPCTSKTSANIWTMPFYRLTKNQDNSATVPRYTWQRTLGKNNEPGGALDRYTYSIEDANAIVGQENAFEHTWSDIKAVLYGAKNRQHTIHMDIVQFEDDHISPVRWYDAASDESTTAHFDAAAYDTEGNPEEFLDNDAWWDHFWATRVGNPIRTSKYVGKDPHKIKWLKKSATTINADASIDNDAAPLRVVKEMFLREEKQYRTDSAAIANAAAPTNANMVVTFNQNVAYDQTRQTKGTDLGTFPVRGTDKWLLIWCGDMYDQLTGAGNGNVCPGFDLAVRSKWKFQAAGP